ncbi:MAG: type II toxin-antitoxin system HicB family antitoxin [Candidatus Paceibacterota bacterium]|jgi:predicted RNase H-like HicB family nuclease
MKNLYSHHYQIVLRPELRGGFTVTVPTLPGCVTYGRDLEEAKEMAKDAISAYVASLKKHHEPIPEDKGVLVTSLNFTYA